MAITLSSEIKQLLDRPNFAHLATLMADGAPHSVPVWVGRDADRIVICTSENSLKGRNNDAIHELPYRSSISMIHTVKLSSEGVLSNVALIQT